MALLSDSIRWGSPISKDTYTQYRIGHRFTQSPATVTASTGLVTVTVEIFVWTKNRIWDTMAKLYWSGSFGSGSASGVTFSTPVNSASGWAQENIVKLRTLTRKVTASESSAITSTIKASMSNVGAVPGTASTSGTWTTAKKPISIFPPEPIVDPMTVTSLTADGTAVLSWSRVSPNDSSKPYVNIDIQMWSPSTGTYNALATTGNTYTYTVQRLQDFSLYRFRARPRNSAGAASSWAYSPFVYTEPDAPRNVKLKANANGTVTVTWDAPVKVPDTSYYSPKYEVVLSENRAGWQYSNAVEVSSRSWTHTGVDPAVEYQYAVRTVGRTSPEVVLYSPYVQSAPIRLSAPPLTPIILGPNEGQRFGEDFSLWWEHNPQDGSDQIGYELEWWTDKDTTVRKVTQTASGWNKVVIRPPQDNDRVRWRVRTKGVHPSFSPWSPVQNFGVSTPPSVALSTSPTRYWGLSPELRATWTYADPAGQAATKYEVRTTDAAGKVVQEYAGETSVASGGTAWSGSVPRLENGETLKVSVRVADAYGVFSDWATASVTGAWAKPVTPALSATWNEDDGTATVRVQMPPTTATDAELEAVEVFRYDGDGAWARVYVGLPDEAGVLEWVDPAPVYGAGSHNLYVARATSPYPTSAMSEIYLLRVNPERCDQWFWISSNAVPSLRVRLRGNPSVKDTAGRERALRTFWGDAYPTEFSGVATPREIDFSGELDPASSTWEEWIAVSQAEGSYIYRDPWGRRLNVSMEPVTVQSGVHRYEGVSVKLKVVRGQATELVRDLVGANRLLESGKNLYRIVTEAESNEQLEEDGTNLYRLAPADGSRISLIEVGPNVYALVNWDEPERVSIYGS